MQEFGSGTLAGIDLTDPKIHADRDLRDVWSFVRNTQPVIWHPSSGGGFWVVSKYYDVRSVYADRANFTSRNGSSLDSLLAGGDPAGGKMLSLSDGARHLAIRSATLKCLRESVIKGIGDSISRNVRMRIPEILDVGCDFVSDLAKHITLDTICDLMGVDHHAHRDTLYSLSSTALSWTERDTTTEQCRIARTKFSCCSRRLSRAAGIDLETT